MYQFFQPKKSQMINNSQESTHITLMTTIISTKTNNI